MSTGGRRDTDIAVANTLLSPEAAEAVPEELKAGDILDGKYELERVLGEGGMGTVWKGAHLGLGIPVAVKTLRSEIARRPDAARRFRREAHAASLLNHKNVVRVLDFGDDRGTLYLVMEYLVGRPLADWVADLRGYMPLTEVASVMVALCDACELAHSYGIVHRDLKPDNVFLTGDDRAVKVVDFGLAHVDDARDRGPTLTSSDVIAGTPEYMSPEQCRSLAVGPSTDLYALGCILTYMLQRKPPFTGSSSIDILAKQMFVTPPPLVRAFDVEPVPVLLERLRLELLSKAPEERPRDAVQVRARLAEAMSAEATLARLPTRKGDEPLGDRAARAPDWQPSQDLKTLRVSGATLSGQPDVGVLRLARRAGGVDEGVETGLASHGMVVRAVDCAATVQPGKLGALVLDGGDAIEETLAALSTIRERDPNAAVLVCTADLGTERMNALVAAGAGDVLRYPVTVDKLARKLSRMLRHRR